MRSLVLDTNVFVAAAFRPASASGRIVAAVRAGSLRMVWTEATRRETERILRRIPPIDARPFMELFRPDDRVRLDLDLDAFGLVPDPEDRKFAALASAAGATLVTNDDHLLSVTISGLDVTTPADFWRALDEQP